MAFTLTNKGTEFLLANAITTATDVRIIVFKGTPPNGATMKDFDNVADAIASTLDEATATSVSWTPGRVDPGPLTITMSEVTDNVVITTPAPVLTSVLTGETWTAVGFYIEPVAGATDTTRTLIGVDIPTPSTLTTNGQNVTLPALLLTITGSTGP
jgi:hypothetical protein